MEKIYVSDKWKVTNVTTHTNMFLACTALVGGEGTAFDDSVVDKTYACIDRAVTEGVKGYLTDKNSAVLTTGSAFNTTINGLFGTSVTKLQFGTFNDVAASNTTLANAWNASTTYVDIANAGAIRVFTSGDTVYVLSEGDRAIYANPSCYNMFAGRVSSTNNTILSNLKEIKGLSELNTSKTTDMSFMFNYCQGLSSLDLSSFDTSNVTTLRAMFQQCTNLTNLNVSSFNTSKVMNMRFVFSNCSSLTSLNVSKFNTSIVTDMTAMFQSCSGLTTLDVSNFDTSGVTSMEALFRNCSGLTTLDVSSFDTSNVTNTVHMFRDLSITTLDISNFDTSSLTNTSNMFNGSSKLKTIYVSELWNMETVTTSPTMFYACYALVGGEGTPFDSAVTDKTYACADKVITNGTMGYLTDKNAPTAAQLTTGSAFNTAINGLFSSSVTKLQFGTYNAYASTVGEWDSSTTYVGIDNNGDGNPDGTIRVFTDTASGTVYVLSDGDRVIYANPDSSDMFAGEAVSIRYNLKEIKGLDVVNTSKVTTMYRMFYYCSVLTSVDVSNFDTSSVTDMYYMFFNCSALTSLDLSSFDTINVNTMYGMFYNCSALTSLDLSSFDTSSVTGMNNMFSYCKALTSLDLSSFDTSSVTAMNYMFSACSNLQTIYVGPAWNTDNVTSSNSMFYDCTALVGENGTTLAKVQANGVTPANSYRATYARIDGGIDSDTPGYLTDRYPRGVHTLTINQYFRNRINDLAKSYPITKLQFGLWSDYGSQNSFTWDDGKELGEETGTIRGFAKDDTVYILSIEGDMFAPESCYYYFWGMNYLTEINGLEYLDTSKVTDMDRMFYGLNKLQKLDLSFFNTSNVTNMFGMFEDCPALTEVDISSFDTSRVWRMTQMFSGCQALTTVYVGDLWNTDPVTSSDNMFNDCTALKGGAGTGFNSGKIDKTYARIDDPDNGKPGYFTAK